MAKMATPRASVAKILADHILPRLLHGTRPSWPCYTPQNWLGSSAPSWHAPADRSRSRALRLLHIPRALIRADCRVRRRPRPREGYAYGGSSFLRVAGSDPD